MLFRSWVTSLNLGWSPGDPTDEELEDDWMDEYDPYDDDDDAKYAKTITE